MGTRESREWDRQLADEARLRQKILEEKQGELDLNHRLIETNKILLEQLREQEALSKIFKKEN